MSLAKYICLDAMIAAHFNYYETSTSIVKNHKTYTIHISNVPFHVLGDELIPHGIDVKKQSEENECLNIILAEYIDYYSKSKRKKQSEFYLRSFVGKPLSESRGKEVEEYFDKIGQTISKQYKVPARKLQQTLLSLVLTPEEIKQFEEHIA